MSALSTSSLEVAPLFWGGFAVFQRVHRVWRWIRIGGLYLQPGHVFYSGVIKVFDVERYAPHWLTRITLITARFLLIIQQYQSLQRNIKTLHLAWHQASPDFMPVKWKNTPFDTLSPSSKLWFRVNKPLLCKIKKVALATFFVVKDGLFLSMRIMDFMEAATASEEALKDGYNELWANSHTCISFFNSHRQEAIKRVRKNSIAIEGVFKKCGIPFSVTIFFEPILFTLEKVDSAQNALSDNIVTPVKKYVTSIGNGLMKFVTNG